MIDRSAESVPVARNQVALALGLLPCLLILMLMCALSLAIGARELSLHTVWQAIFHFNGSPEQLIVQTYRVPRTVLGVFAGIALGVSGMMIQGLTRNPLADPGILGVNAGAAFAVTIAVGVFGFTAFHSYVWFAFGGAVVVTAAVYRLGSLGRGGATPIRLTLAGIALGAVLGGVDRGLPLVNAQAFNAMRTWHAGTLAGRDMDVVVGVTPFIIVGLLIAGWVARSLNAMAMGDDLAVALGVKISRTRALGVVSLTLLSGAATAAVGPIGFVGLMVPHVVRWFVGPDQRWIFVYSLVSAPILLLLADIVGRVVVRPDEMPSGVVTAFIGAPILIWLVRRERATGL